MTKIPGYVPAWNTVLLDTARTRMTNAFRPQRMHCTDAAYCYRRSVSGVLLGIPASPAKRLNRSICRWGDLWARGTKGMHISATQRIWSSDPGRRQITLRPPNCSSGERQVCVWPARDVETRRGMNECQYAAAVSRYPSRGARCASRRPVARCTPSTNATCPFCTAQ